MSSTARYDTRDARAGVGVRVIAGFLALLYVLEAVDVLLAHRLDRLGIRPRLVEGLDGIVFAPLLHLGWMHLLANTLPLAVLGYLILCSGLARWVAVTAVVWVVGGVGTWVTGDSGSLHLGASVLVFGWLAYLLLRGFFSRSAGQILIGAVIFVLYGSALLGVLPGQPGISWQGHLFGAAGGVLAAWWLAGRDRRTRGNISTR